MEQVVPRWEWRAFGDSFGAAEPRLAALTVEKVQTSEEIYLVAENSDASVKIRNQLLDIKSLDRVDSNGLEQWRPALKAPFPLADSAVAEVRAALGLPAISKGGDRISLDRLLADLAGAPVRVIRVTKTRARHRIEGCVAELTDVVADGHAVRTVAIEDADPAKVIAAVRSMGLEAYPNTSYPRGLKQVIGLTDRGTH
jgi:exopolyphosphatase / guanosine-5'-triphosphate,3'-diphosphate pyrophosphatase